MEFNFSRIYHYNQWANLGLCKHIQSQPSQLPQVMKLMSHLVAAEEVWYHRIEPLPFEPLPLFEAQRWEVLQPRLEQSAQRWIEWVDAQDNFQQVISYRTTKGELFESTLEDILFHLANHGSYHRGQVAMVMRQSGQTPLVTDYIAFCRD